MESTTHVALIGAGGNLGKFVVEELRQHPLFHLTIIARESSKSTSTPNLRLIKVDDDYSEESLVRAFQGQDVVINMNNARANSAQYRIIDAAVKAQVKRYVPSDFGGQAENSKASEIFPVLAGHKQVVDYLREQEGAGLTWTAIIPGIFFDLAIQNGFMGYDFSTRTARIWDSGDARFSTSTRPQIAKAIVAVLNRLEATRNRYIYSASFTTSQNQILRSLERITGTTWVTTTVKTDDMIELGREGLRTGDFMKMSNLALAVLYGGDAGADAEAAGKLNNQLLGLGMEDMDEVLKALVPQQ